MTGTAVVFGGSGFFGTHLVRHLLGRGDVETIVVADLVEPRLRHAKVRFVRCDVREPISLPVEGPVAIYNFAAVHTTPGHSDWEYFWTNVQGAIEVCRFAEAVGARRLVFTSSTGVFGEHRDRIDDGTVPVPVSAYGKSKLLAERIHEDWQARDSSRRLLVVRPAVTFGEGERGNFQRLAGLLRRGQFVYPARKDTIKACAPVEELPRCLDYMAEFDEPLVRFIFAYPERTTIEDINRAFHRAAGFRLPAVVVPRGLIEAGALGFEALGRMGLRTPINRARIRKLIQANNAYPAELMRRGWRFELTLTEALRRWNEASAFQ